MKSERRFRIFLAALAITGSFLVLLATSRYGPGLSTDGARYLSTAENIARGQGLIDYLGLPLINWPPLYPLILAGIKLLTGLDVFVIGQILNILAFGGIIWLSGFFFERSLPNNKVFPVIGSLVVATSLSVIEVSANIASDPLFMIFVLLFLLVAQNYLRTSSWRSWWLLAAMAAASSFIRYAGLALILSGAIITFISLSLKPLRAGAAKRGNPQQISGRTRGLSPSSFGVARSGLIAIAFGFAAGAPIASWAIFHNYRLGGSVLGSHLPAYPWGLFLAWVEKTFSWFVPQAITNLLPPILLLALVILVIALRSNRERWSSFAPRLQQAALLPTVVFFIIYGLMLVFTISYPEHHGLGSQRIHVITLPILLVLIAVMAQEFLPRLPRKPRILRNALLFIFGLWLLFPLYRVAVYVLASRENGDISYYNIYNTKILRESDIVAHIQSMPLGPDEKVYSNNEAAAWFYLRRRIYRLPRYDPEQGQDFGEVMHSFDGWPAANETATLIWFKRELDYKELVPRPEQMQEFMRLTPTFTGRYGIVYLMDAP